MKANRLQIRVMLLVGVAVCLILPGVLASRALRTAHAGALRQDRPSEALDAARVASLTKLQAELRAGVPFSHEETDILDRFGSGGEVDAFEADVLISRVLYAYSKGMDLSPEMENVVKRYKEHIAPLKINIADGKEHNHAIELKEPPRAPAVAPSNDLCAGAEVVPAAGPFPYLTAVTADITDATVTGDPPLPSCQSNVSRSIWYTFTPSASASYVLSLCADAPTGTTVDDTVIAVYTSASGCAGPFTQVVSACDDDTCVTESFQSVVTTNLTSGTQYFVVVWKFDQPAPTAGNTAVQLRVSQVIPPANDTCAGAIPLTLNIPVQGTMNSLTVNNYQLVAASPCYTGVGQSANILAGRDLVYTFTAPAAGNYSFRVWSWSGTTNPGIYTATTCPVGAPPQTVTCIAASNRNTTTTQGAEEITCQALSSGQQVFFFVDEVTVASTATVTFFAEVLPCVSEVEANDTPATANTYQCGIQGGTTPAGDVDFYSLGTPASGARVFAMLDSSPGSSNDHDLRVTTSTDTLEYDNDGNANTFGSAAPNIAGARATGVQTFLSVNHRTGLSSEPYRIFSVVQPPGAGTFGSSAANEAEPNNSIGQANVSPGNYFYGTVTASPLDNDFYRFTANAGDTIFVSLDADPSRVTGTVGSSSPLDAILVLFNSAGTQLVGVDDIQTTSSVTSGAGSLTAVTPFAPSEALVFHAQTTGTYYVGVGAFAGTGDYLLSISVNCAVGGGVSGCTGITCPANVTQTNDPNQCGAVVNYPAPTSSGTCGTISCSPASGSFFQVGTTTVTCTSSAGPTCQFTVTVTDDQPPSITCPANITRSNDPNQCGAVVTYPPPTITDNCLGSFTATCTPASGSFFPVGTTTVTCEVDGASGNNKASVAKLGGVIPKGVQPGCSTITQSTSQTVTFGNSVACSDQVTGFTTENSYYRAFTLTSFGIGNAFDVQSVDIGIDEATSGGGKAPKSSTSISRPKKNTGKTKGKVAAPQGGGQPLTVNLYTSSSAFPTGFPGSLTLIGTTNISVADQTATILNIPVTGTAPAGSQLVVEILSPDGRPDGNFFFIGSNTAAETGPSYLRAPDCGINSPATTAAIGFPGMHIVMNVNGCEQQQTGGGPSCTFTVTVNDTQPPVITCPNNIFVAAAATCPPAGCTVVNYTTPATDNCGVVTVVCNPPSGSCFPVGTTTVTCTATDASGNTATCTFKVEVFSACLQDESNPGNVVLFNTLTGEYRFCCNGQLLATRTGVLTMRGCIGTIDDLKGDRKVHIEFDFSAFGVGRGTASIFLNGSTNPKCTITDQNMSNNQCTCPIAAPAGVGNKN